MLKTKLVHPEILKVLASAGHGSKILLADGDYPASTTAGRNTTIVHLNVSAGLVNCTQILEVLLPTVLVEKAEVMGVPSGQPDPEIWSEFSTMLRKNNYPDVLHKLKRFAFYDTVASDSTALIIQTGELREYANLLLTIGSL
jgi:L-fucose mutarotase